MTMNIKLLGISYKTAPIDIREKYSFTNSKKIEFLNFVRNTTKLFDGLVLLSTCNRTEIYFEPADFRDKEAFELLISLLGIKEEHLKHFYYKSDKGAFEHLCCVVCGLDSQVIGETEIVEQLKEAYNMSLKLGLTSKLINFLFQKCFSVSKKVRTLTGIQKGCLSYGSIIFKITKEHFCNEELKNIVIIGTGKMASKVAEFFKGYKIFFVSSKHYQKALTLANLFNGVAIKYEKLFEVLKIADVIITASYVNKCIIKDKYFEHIKKEKILIFDLGVPRNVDSSITKYKDNVVIYTLDDLNFLKDENYKMRLKHKIAAKNIINFEVNKIWEKILQSQQYLQQLDLVVGQVS